MVSGNVRRVERGKWVLKQIPGNQTVNMNLVPVGLLALLSTNLERAKVNRHL
jgi:hypothetical protein